MDVVKLVLHAVCFEICFDVFCRPGGDLLSRVLRRSTISAGAFHGRVRNGIGCSRSAITTRSAKHIKIEKLFFCLLSPLFGDWRLAFRA
jgi:hypothetical protein